MNNNDKIRALCNEILGLLDQERKPDVIFSHLVKYRYVQWDTKDSLDILIHVSSLDNGHLQINTCSAWIEDKCAFETLCDFGCTTNGVLDHMSGSDHVRICIDQLMLDVLANESGTELDRQFMAFIASLLPFSALISVTEI